MEALPEIMDDPTIVPGNVDVKDLPEYSYFFDFIVASDVPGVKKAGDPLKVPRCHVASPHGFIRCSSIH